MASFAIYEHASIYNIDNIFKYSLIAHVMFNITQVLFPNRKTSMGDWGVIIFEDTCIGLISIGIIFCRNYYSAIYV